MYSQKKVARKQPLKSAQIDFNLQWLIKEDGFVGNMTITYFSYLT